MTRPDYLTGLFGLKGRVALVTGASSGIGRRIASALGRAGASVVGLARREAALQALVAELGEGAAAALTADLAAVEDFTDLAARASEPFGPPDILVNAAGINLREPAEAVSLGTWNLTLRVNLTVPFFLAQALVPAMRAKGAGRIITIASLQTWRAFPNSIPYGASKAGVGQLTRAMAEAWSRDGITANAIAPGFVPTELTDAVFRDEALVRHHAAATAIGRTGLLEDLDGAAIFLASRASDYVTGQVLAVDGGYTAK